MTTGENTSSLSTITKEISSLTNLVYGKRRGSSASSVRDPQTETYVPSEQSKRRELSAPLLRGNGRIHYRELTSKISEKYNVPETSVIPVTDCKNGRTIIIFYSDSVNMAMHSNFAGYDIILKNPNVVSREARMVMQKCKTQQLHISVKQRNQLKDLIQKYAEKWFSAHSNLNIISTSPVKSRGGEMEMNHPCIVLYCTSKGYIPVGENEFPRTVSMGNRTVDIDVREGHFQFDYNTKASNLPHDKLRMGCEFSAEGSQYSGTIGPFVDYHGQVAFLTCAHTIFGIDCNGYDKTNENPFVQQPASSDPKSTNHCGQVRHSVFHPKSSGSSVDAAVVVLKDQARMPCRGEFAIAKELQYKKSWF